MSKKLGYVYDHIKKWKKVFVTEKIYTQQLNAGQAKISDLNVSNLTVHHEFKKVNNNIVYNNTTNKPYNLILETNKFYFLNASTGNIILELPIINDVYEHKIQIKNITKANYSVQFLSSIKLEPQMKFIPSGKYISLYYQSGIWYVI